MVRKSKYSEHKGKPGRVSGLFYFAVLAPWWGQREAHWRPILTVAASVDSPAIACGEGVALFFFARMKLRVKQALQSSGASQITEFWGKVCNASDVTKLQLITNFVDAKNPCAARTFRLVLQCYNFFYRVVEI